jgi:hypothetical protein
MLVSYFSWHSMKMSLRCPALITALVMAIATEAYSVVTHSYFISGFENGSTFCVGRSSNYDTRSCSYSVNGSTLTLETIGASNTYSLPAGASVVSASWVSSCQMSVCGVSPFGSGAGSCSIPPFEHAFTGPSSYAWRINCILNLIFNTDVLPPCSQPISISVSQCKGGTGLWASGGTPADMFGSFTPDPETGFRTSTTGAVILSAAWYDSNAPGTELNPNGSECTVDTGHRYEYIVCPLGLADPDPDEDPVIDPPADPPFPDLCVANPDHPNCRTLDEHCALFPESISCPSACQVNPSLPWCNSDPPPDPAFCDQIPAPPGCNDPPPHDPPDDPPEYVPFCERPENASTEYCRNLNSGSGGDPPPDGPPPGSGDNGPGGGGNLIGPGGINPGAASSSSGDPGEGPGGISCKDLANCNWATIGNQLEQMAIDREQMDTLKAIVNALRDGHNLSKDQISKLQAMKQSLDSLSHDLNTGFTGVAQSLKNGFDGVVSAVGELIDKVVALGKSSGDGPGDGDSAGSGDYPHICDNPGNQHLVQCGGNGNPGGGDSAGSGNSDCDGYEFECSGEKGILTGIKDKLGDIYDGLFGGDGGGVISELASEFGGAADTSGMSGKANSLIAGGGRTTSIYTDGEIGALIPIPRSGQCPVISGKLGGGGLGEADVKFDFNDLAPGSNFNLAMFVKSILLLMVYFANVFSMIAIFRSGGNR